MLVEPERASYNSVGEEMKNDGQVSENISLLNMSYQESKKVSQSAWDGEALFAKPWSSGWRKGDHSKQVILICYEPLN